MSISRPDTPTLRWHGTAQLKSRIERCAAGESASPLVEVLFKAAATALGPNAIGVMLTGMGKDGAAAMLEMKPCLSG